mgnify:CR=1 FL=1
MNSPQGQETRASGKPRERRLIEDADERRAKRFFADARLPRAERAELEGYKNSGYSRGHMAPVGGMPTPTAMAQSFSLANMVPQNAQHNGGAWAKIEQDTRHYVKRATGDVFVITGPVFTDAGPHIGANGVKVPTYLFKLVYDATTQRAWAHWQQNREGETVGRPISYQELVTAQVWSFCQETHSSTDHQLCTQPRAVSSCI